MGGKLPEDSDMKKAIDEIEKKEEEEEVKAILESEPEETEEEKE